MPFFIKRVLCKSGNGGLRSGEHDSARNLSVNQYPNLGSGWMFSGKGCKNVGKGKCSQLKGHLPSGWVKSTGVRLPRIGSVF